jgi:hypothetical protein
MVSLPAAIICTRQIVIARLDPKSGLPDFGAYQMIEIGCIRFRLAIQSTSTSGLLDCPVKPGNDAG